MDSLRFRSWKDFYLSWWNALASAWFPASAILKVWHCGSNFVLVYAIMHEKSRTDICESWQSCPWQYFFEVLIAGSLACLYSWIPTTLFYLHRGTSLIGSCWHVWHCFSGRAALGLSFREHRRRNGQICPFSFEDIISLTMDPGHVISNHRDGSCQLSSLLGGFRRFHFGWSFRFQQIIFHNC